MMDKRLLSEAAAVTAGSLLSFASPAAATYLGAQAGGVPGAVAGWVFSALFVLAVVFPKLGAWVDYLGGKPQQG